MTLIPKLPCNPQSSILLPWKVLSPLFALLQTNTCISLCKEPHCELLFAPTQTPWNGAHKVSTRRLGALPTAVMSQEHNSEITLESSVLKFEWIPRIQCVKPTSFFSLTGNAHSLHEASMHFAFYIEIYQVLACAYGFVLEAFCHTAQNFLWLYLKYFCKKA